jgi:hypothetical protein
MLPFCSNLYIIGETTNIQIDCASLPPLVCGYFIMTASVNPLTEAVTLNQPPPPLIDCYYAITSVNRWLTELGFQEGDLDRNNGGSREVCSPPIKVMLCKRNTLVV